MSFLNPVSEPVKRFSSADANAPQISYNARVSGDVKAVLKACLVTGYGSKESAGWSVVNEVNHVAEFVSPSAGMSDYRLGIDDASTSSTIWYYQYQDARINPTNNSITKNIQSITTNSVNNGWQLLVTDLGFILVEIFHNPAINNQLARVMYWGKTKSAIVNDSNNIAFWSVGYNAPIVTPSTFFGVNVTNNKHCIVGEYNSLAFSSATLDMAAQSSMTLGGVVEIADSLYLRSGSVLVAEQPGFLLKNIITDTELFGIKDIVFENIPMLKVSIGQSFNTEAVLKDKARILLIKLNNWEY